MTGDSILNERPARPLPMWDESGCPACNPNCPHFELVTPTPDYGHLPVMKVCTYPDLPEVVERECKPTLQLMRALVDLCILLGETQPDHMKWFQLTGNANMSIGGLSAFARSVIGDDTGDDSQPPALPIEG